MTFYDVDWWQERYGILEMLKRLFEPMNLSV